MTPADRIRALAARTRDDLGRVWNYYTHTRFAWKLFEKGAAEGRDERYTDPDTGAVTDSPELVGLAERYVAGYLAESVLQQFVALFEDYLFGLLRVWLTAFPKGIAGLDESEADDRFRRTDKTVPLSLVIDSPDRETILRAVVDRELDGLKYRRLAAWFAYLNDRAKLGVPAADRIDRLAEAKAARDVITHNRGVVNAVYLAKAGPLARYADGDLIEIDEPYLKDVRELIEGVVGDTAGAALAKLAA